MASGRRRVHHAGMRHFTLLVAMLSAATAASGTPPNAEPDRSLVVAEGRLKLYTRDKSRLISDWYFACIGMMT